eukprot:TRINITY_DN436_c0_g6_i1.p1 TRINITY_DN436_c0_g6~~TRINITY_DN436_c0_g6_i1.p1  ORF type:complete len:682 (-),score=245.91 TRINITY_DN436_c0_g6_i1:165-2210(-)
MSSSTMNKLLFALAVPLSVGIKTESQTGANPVRRVVTMLQKMSEKIEKEGDKEKDLFDKFMCHCKEELAAFKGGKAKYEADIAMLKPEIEQTEATINTLTQEIDTKKTEKKEAVESKNTATVQRKEEQKEFDKKDAELKDTIASINDAIPALEKAMGGGTGFLQTRSKVLSHLSAKQVTRLEQVVMNSKSATEEDRDLIRAFLQKEASLDGIDGDSSTVKTMLTKTLDETTAEEEGIVEEEKKAVKVFKQLLQSKTEEIATLEETTSQKIDRRGELKVKLVELKGQLSDAERALGKDFGVLQKLSEECKAKEADWDVRTKTRAEELLAIQDTIKILNSDDALDMFKKTLSSPSLLQLERTHDHQRRTALKHIQEFRKHKGAAKVQSDLILLTLSSKGVDFSKVQKMIDDMVTLLKKEQQDEDDKKDYCGEQFFENEKKVKALNRKIKTLDEAIKAKTADNETLTTQIAELSEGVKNLDKSVTESTDQRQKEHQEYEELLASNGQAKDLLVMAKNRMNQFYHPELAPESFLQEVSKHFQEDEERPEEYGEHKTKEGQGNKVVNMIQGLMTELDKENAEAKHDETEGQKMYEEFMADAKDKRASDMQAIAGKTKAKAEAEEEKVTKEASVQSEGKELMDVQQTVVLLHKECDWLQQNYEARKKARTEEKESLKQSKDILAGAA